MNPSKDLYKDLETLATIKNISIEEAILYVLENYTIKAIKQANNPTRKVTTVPINCSLSKMNEEIIRLLD